jgi:hypothetical protein
MVNETGFRAALKQRGKQPAVIDGLLRQVQAFEAYLQAQRQVGLDQAAPGDIQAYARFLDGEKQGSAHTPLRGVALYYRFLGMPELAECANALREAGVADNRKAPPLGKFLWVDEIDIARLRQAGIRDSQQMLAAGRTPQMRSDLAARCGVAPQAILELVMLSDLARIPGLKAVRARLYYNAGLRTPQEIAACETEPLRLQLEQYVQRTDFPGIPPLPREVQSTIASARRLQALVEYEAG